MQQQMQTQGINALMPEPMMEDNPSQFATLQPYGSKPSRFFGSSGIQGLEQAYIQQDGQPAMPERPLGGVTRARLSPQQTPKDSYRVPTKEEYAQYNIDPLTQQMTINDTTKEPKILPRVSKEQALIDELEAKRQQILLLEALQGQGLSQAQLQKARVDASKAQDDLDKIKETKLLALGNIIQMEDAVRAMSNNSFIDTGQYEQIMQYTPTDIGKQQRRISDITKQSADAVKAYIRLAGQGDLNASEQEWAIGVYPNIGLDYASNVERVRSLKQRFMKYNKVDYIVRTPEEFAKLPIGAIYFNPITIKKMIKVKE